MSTIAKDKMSTCIGFRVFSVIRTIIIYCPVVFIIVFAIFFAADKSPDKSLFGFRYYIVLTDSMVPEFASGDMVFVQLSNADNIVTGDVITFNPSSGGDAYLTHRVTEKITDYNGTGATCFRTKGDANNAEDSFLIDESRVIGKVKFHIPKLGLIVRLVQLRWYFIVPLAILLFIFLRMMKYYFSLKAENDDEHIDNNSGTETET